MKNFIKNFLVFLMFFVLAVPISVSAQCWHDVIPLSSSNPPTSGENDKLQKTSNGDIYVQIFSTRRIPAGGGVSLAGAANNCQLIEANYASVPTQSRGSAETADVLVRRAGDGLYVHTNWKSSMSPPFLSTINSVSDGWLKVGAFFSGPTITSVAVSTVANQYGTNAIRGGTPLQFSAAVVASPNTSENQTVTWQITTDGIAQGTNIDNTGLLTVALGETNNNITVKATSTHDANKSNTATVSVVNMAVNTVSISPSSYSIKVGQGFQFTPNVNTDNGAPTTVNWSISGNSHDVNTEINGGFLYISESEASETITIVATSTFDPNKSGQAVITVMQEDIFKVVSVSVSPPSATVTKGEWQQFNSSVETEFDELFDGSGTIQDVIWSVENNISQNTGIDQSGILTVAINETASTIKVVATSAHAEISGFATVTVSNGIVNGVTVSPSTATVKSQRSVDLTAVVDKTGVLTGAVTWSITTAGGAGASSIVSTGNTTATFTAGDALTEDRANITVRATSTENNLKYAEAVITIQKLYDCSTVAEWVNPSGWWVGNLVIGTNYRYGDKLYKIIVNQMSAITENVFPNPTSTTHFEYIGDCAPTVVVSSVAVNPNSAGVAKGGNQAFTATVTVNPNDNDYKKVNWSVSGKNSAQTVITNAGVLTVGADETAQTLTVTASSVEAGNTNVKGTATITVLAGTVNSITINPTAVALDKLSSINNKQTFSHTIDVIPSNENGVTWSRSGNTSNNTTVVGGLFTLAADEEADQITVTVTSNADPRQSASATVTNSKIKSLDLNPSTSTVAQAPDAVALAVEIVKTGLYTGAVNWSIISPAVLAAGTGLSAQTNSGATLNIGATETAYEIVVKVQSTEDVTKSATATITITDNEPKVTDVTINTSAGTAVERNQTLALGVDITKKNVADNAPNNNIVWEITSSKAAGTTISGDKNGATLTVAANETARTITVKATSTYTPETYDIVNIAVKAVWGVVVSGAESIQRGSAAQTFNASVDATGTASQNVVWSISGGNTSAQTAIDADGKLTVGIDEELTQITVIATSQFDATVKGQKTVSVTKPSASSISVSPNNDNANVIKIVKGNNLQFTALVLPQAANQNTVWNVTGSNGGLSTINGSGLLSVGANETAQMLTVTAASGDEQQTASVTVKIIGGTVSAFAISGDKVVHLIHPNNSTQQHEEGVDRWDFDVAITVVPSSANGVHWAIDSDESEIGPAGVFTLSADEEADTIKVIATSIADPDFKDSAKVVNSRVKSVTINNKENTIANVSVGHVLFSEHVVRIGEGKVSDLVEWKILSGVTSTGTHINEAGYLTIGSDEKAFRIEVEAKSVFNANIKDTGYVTITANIPSVSAVQILHEGVLTVERNNTFNFTVDVEGTNLYGDNAEVIWEIITEGKAAGTTISGDKNGAVLTVANNETLRNITIKASSKHFPAESDTKTVAVKAVWSVEVDGAASIERGSAAQTFNASVEATGGASQNVVWSVSGKNSSGTDIDAETGELTVGVDETAEMITVIATSAFEGVSGEKTIEVTKPAVQSIAILPSGTITVTKGGTKQFDATVLPQAAEQNVIWSISGNEENSSIVNGLLSVASNETAEQLTVTAAAGGAWETVNVTVIDAVVSFFEIAGDKNIALIKGETHTFGVNIEVDPVERSEVNFRIISAGASSSINQTTGEFTLALNEELDEIEIEAASVADPDKKDYATVINSKINNVTVSPKTKTIEEIEDVQFGVAVVKTGKYTNEVIWSIVNSTAKSAGTTINNGLLTIAENETAINIEVEAKSIHDQSKFDRATVTITANIPAIKSVTISPNPASVAKGGTVEFTAVVDAKGGADKTVTWKRTDNKANSTVINPITGKLTVAAGETATSIKVIATSNFDQSITDTVEVLITDVVSAVASVTVSPKGNVAVTKGETQQFVKTVLPANAPQNVIWTVEDALSLSTSIDQNGLLTVAADETAQLIKVIATSVSDGTKKDIAEVTVTGSDEPKVSNGPAKTRSDFGILLYQTIATQKAVFEILTPEPANVTVAIFDNQGNALFTLKHNTAKSANVNSLKVDWNLTNVSGRKVGAGVYMIQATATSASGKTWQYAAPIGVKKN